MDGLRLVVGADITEAQQALKNLVTSAADSGNKAGTALASGLNKASATIQDRVAAISKTIASLSGSANINVSVTGTDGIRKFADEAKAEIASIGNSPLSTSAITKYNEAILKLKSDASSIVITPVLNTAGINNLQDRFKSIQQSVVINADTSSLKTIDIGLKEIQADANTAKIAISSIGTAPISAAQVENINKSIQAVKNNAASIVITPNINDSNIIARLKQIQHAAATLKPIDINVTATGLSAIDAAINKISVDAKLATQSISGISGSVLSTEGIARYNAAIQELKANLAGVKISPVLEQIKIPPVTIPVAKIEIPPIAIPQIPPLKIPVDTTQASESISRLGATLNSLLERKANIQVSILNENDINKVGILNAQLESVDQEIRKVTNAGRVGFDDFGNAITGAAGSIAAIEAKISQTKGFVNLEPDIKEVEKLNAEIEDLELQLRKLKTVGRGGVTAAQFDELNRGVTVAGASLKKTVTSSNQASFALTNLGRVAQDAPFGFIGIANNLNPLLESFQRLKATSGTTGNALKALGSSLLGAGGIGLALSVVSSLLIVFGDKLFGASKKATEAQDALKQYKDAVNGIFGSAGKEAADTAGLIAVLKSETETRQRKIDALKELKAIQPEIFGQLKLEQGAVIGLDAAYKNYLDNLRTVIAVKIKQLQLENKVGELLKTQGETLTKGEKTFSDAIKNINKLRVQPKGIGTDIDFGVKDLVKEEQKQVKILQADIDQLVKDIAELSKGVTVKTDTTGIKDADKAIDDLIKQAQRLAAFLNKTTQREFRFEIDPEDTKAETFEKAKKFIQDALDPLQRQDFKIKPQIQLDIDKGLKDLEQDALNKIGLVRLPDGNITILVKPKIQLTEFQKLSVSDISKTSLKTYDELKKQFEDSFSKLNNTNPIELNFFTQTELKTEKFLKPIQDKFKNTPAEIKFTPKLELANIDVLRGFNEAFENAGIKFTVPVDFKLTGDVSAQAKALFAKFTAALRLEDLETQLEDILTNFAAQAASQIGIAIGNVISGQSPGFESFFQILSSAMKQFGEALIAFGLAKQVLVDFGKLNPVTAIVAGVGLVALSQVVGNFKPKGLAAGGLATGPTLALVGEGRGTSVNNPEVIAPLDKLKGMLANLSPGNGAVRVMVTGKLRGQDMALQTSRTSRSQRRLGA